MKSLCQSLNLTYNLWINHKLLTSQLTIVAFVGSLWLCSISQLAKPNTISITKKDHYF